MTQRRMFHSVSRGPASVKRQSGWRWDWHTQNIIKGGFFCYPLVVSIAEGTLAAMTSSPIQHVPDVVCRRRGIGVGAATRLAWPTPRRSLPTVSDGYIGSSPW
jgi:hypothetical protein